MIADTNKGSLTSGWRRPRARRQNKTGRLCGAAPHSASLRGAPRSSRLLGALLIFRTWAMTVIVLMSLLVIRRANLEEALLELEYGVDWKEYVSDVAKWVPQWGKRN